MYNLEPPPDGYAWVWVPSEEQPHNGWELLAKPTQQYGCRGDAAPGHSVCGRPSVARLNRARRGVKPRWWYYCEDHLYGQQIRNGVLERLVLQALDGSDD